MSNQSSIGGIFKSFDLFRKLPSDITHGTSSGGVISLLFIIFMIFLTIHEIDEYSHHYIKTEMFILDKSVDEPL